NGLDGTLVNGPSYVAGMIEEALAFDGVDDYADVPADPTLDTFPLTVAAWIKTTDTGLHGDIENSLYGKLEDYDGCTSRRSICDCYGNSRVHKYDPKGRHLFSWGEPGTDPGCFNVPHNIATDADGVVYVADRENHRVQVFDGKGHYLTQLNNLHRPCGLFADRRNGGLL